MKHVAECALMCSSETSVMFYIFIFSLLGFMLLEAARDYLLCKSSSIEIRYTLWDEKNPPIVSMHPCDINPGTGVNFSLTWIPKVDLQHITVKVQLWRQTLKILEYDYNICSGVDDEFEMCGTLKGETLTITKVKGFSNLPVFKDTLFVMIQMYAGRQRELALGSNVTFVNL